MSSTTKRALAASFKKLLNSRPLDKITVKDIVEDAQVNRQTFYYHFRDIYDLVRWIFDGETQVSYALENEDYDWQSHLKDIFACMLEERILVMNAYHSLCREHLEQYLYQVIYTMALNKLEENCEGLTVSDEDKRFIADFLKYAFVGILLEWIRKGMRDDSEILVDKLIHMMEGELRRCLEKFSS